ncbi:hypothetical protein VD0004_g4658 [Verticillium dahliae]|nr:hypothetical protein VD0004_g4658 [Verticillium dahliae]PNH71566.1 hypothetical protein VD0001_g5995 [Verticillium dahliae]
MTTAARARGFGNFNMNNTRDDNPAKGMAAFRPSTKGIWENAYQGSKRASDNALPTGSGALIPDSQADTSAWTTTRPWNPDSTQTRSTSGSTSPTRTRDNLFFDNPNGAFGQARFANGRPKSFLEEEKENSSYGPNFGAYEAERGFARHEKRGSQERTFMTMGAVGAPPSRDGSIPPSRHSEESHHSPPAFRDTFGYPSGHTPSNSIASHAQRPSIPGHSSSFPSQSNSTNNNNNNNSRSYMTNGRMDEADLSSQFSKGLTLDDATALSQVLSNGGNGQSFQLNPGSQPWLGGFNQHAPDVYSDYMTQYLASKRPSVDRYSPAPAAYRVANVPKSYSPHPTDPWSQRAAHRDPRMVPDAERRTPAPYMQPQAQPFFPGPYYTGQYPAQFPPSLYDFAGRAPMIPGYGLPMGYPLTGHVPARPAKDQDSGKGVRSVLLEEFRSSSKSNKRYDLKDIYGHVVEFSGDQHGSRFIQQKLETANSDEKDQIFREIEPNAVQLMKDVFGNYVIQKFFEHGNQVQKKVLAAQMKGKVVDLSMQMYACRVVQKALEHVLVEQQAELVDELQPDIVKVVKDQNGNHVVQKVIELVPRQYIDFVMDSFRGQVSQLAAHTYGCRVIQRMLEYGTDQDKEVILTELHNSAQVLITDQYGNYVTQHVIQHGKPEDRAKMIHLVTSQLVTLSKHKFASNVVEKCIEHGSPEERKSIREQLTTMGPDGTSPLQLMMKDQYGNYVIQKLLNQLDGADREAFIEEMKPQFIALKKTSTGRQIAAIDRLIFAASSPAPPRPGSSKAMSGQNTPALQVDSSAPTPVLTMEPNSPQSSSPPSTNASAVGETAEEDRKAQLHPGGASLRVQVEDA